MKNQAAAKFSSSAALYKGDQSLSLQCMAGVKNSSLATDSTAYYAFKWSFDVYKGSSKFTSTNLSASGSFKANTTP